ncbi:MAG: SurA N-terminal domain-containing protein, partial [Desulfuromonadales bacterium]|nr:SurA N-terminal domain-containing protein [Desulfuromonadales bacterium]
MRYFGIALLLICSIGLTSVSAKVVSRVAAVVNKEIISTHQLDQRLQEQLAKQQKQPSPVQMGALRQELLSRMIEESLVQQRIAALNLTVSEEEIETALVDVQKKNKLSRDDLEDAVQTQGLDFDDYRDNLRQQILRYKLISEEVRSQIDVPERELVEYYRAHLDDYRLPPEVELSALSFPVSEKASEQERTQIRKMANEALTRLQQGEALAEVADSYNQTYGATGGSMGKFVYEELTPKFVEAINKVEDGTFTTPVEMDTAIHLLRVDDRLSEGLRQFDEV